MATIWTDQQKSTGQGSSQANWGDTIATWGAVDFSWNGLGNGGSIIWVNQQKS